MPAQPLDDKTVASLIGDAIAAPSLHNTQPWRFFYFKESRTVHVRSDPERAVPHVDPQGRALRISCGAALLNLRVAAARAGWDPVTMLLPAPEDPGLVATVQMLYPTRPDEGLARLYPAIHNRAGASPAAGHPRGPGQLVRHPTGGAA